MAMQPVVVIEKVSVPMVSCVSMLAERRELATAGDDKLIKIWNSDDGRLVRSYEAHRGSVTSLTWIPHLRFLASTSLDHTLALWNFKGECVTRSKFPTALYSSGFSQKHDTLVVGGLRKMYIIQVGFGSRPCPASPQHQYHAP
jgi:WD40 repeat protein